MISGASTTQSFSRAPVKAQGGSLFTIILFISVFFVPMKGLSLNVGGQSIYMPYLGLAAAVGVCLPQIAEIFIKQFAGPMLVVAVLTLFYFWQTDFQATVFVFGAKIFITLAMSALYVHLLRIDERRVMHYLFLACAVSIVYMVYQAISSIGFGSTLPFTGIESLQIGRGLSSRYGLVRTTGFTEEPSYIAVMLVGTLMMLRSYQIRTGESQKKRWAVLIFGLMLCTSNSLFATIPLLILFGFCYQIGAPYLFLILFYAVSLAAAPYLIHIDESFFARFMSYNQFLKLPSSQWWFGIGFNQYSTLEFPQYVSPEGVPTLIVDGIASLWGGLLLEGGIIFSALFCAYVSGISKQAKNSTGLAFMAILIMLADYYSPWWPIVSLALAYTIVSRDPILEQESESSLEFNGEILVQEKG